MADDSGEEKSLPPSQKKLRKAREEGNVPHSPLMVTAATSIAGIAYFWVMWPTVEGKLKGLFINAALMQPVEFRFATQSMMSDFGSTVMGIGLPPLIAVMVAGILVNIIDLKGIVFSTKPITPNFTKLNPAEGFKRMFGQRGMVESIQGMVKLAIFVAAAIVVIMMGLNTLFQAPFCDKPCVVGGFESLLKQLLILFIILLLVSGVVDLLVQRWLFKKDMMMSVSEMKREMKESYGSPEIRSARRRIAREISQSATKLGAPNATIVIEGGGAVIALRFVRNETAAPVIVAKGFGEKGAEIAKTARELGRPFHADADLAASLLRDAPMGQFIPQAYFERVAGALVRSGAL
jgi:type III secretion protein U